MKNISIIPGIISRLKAAISNRMPFTAPGDITASNIDDYTTTGLYQAYFNANINNGVAGAWGTLQVVHVNSVVVEQMMSTPLGVAVRHKEYSTWSAWGTVGVWTEEKNYTLSTSAIDGFYWTNVTPSGDINKIISAIVVVSASNRFANCQILKGDGLIRVYGYSSGNTGTVRIAYRR